MPSGLGLIFSGLAVNFTSSLIDKKIVHAGGEREHTRLIEQGLAASDAGVGLVVLAACQSASVAGVDGSMLGGVAPALIAHGVPMMVAMQLTVRQDAANAATHVIYEQLAAGSSVRPPWRRRGSTSRPASPTGPPGTCRRSTRARAASGRALWFSLRERPSPLDHESFGPRRARKAANRREFGHGPFTFAPFAVFALFVVQTIRALRGPNDSRPS